ncbi:MAG: DUF2027 domain-containing protein [Bacteroidetes bacterium]|nr:DUF2027 domain-containing protein [Bacteroidota bacterium]
MKFRIGEKVKFLNDTSKGIVTGFLNEKTVLVKIEEGFEVPVLKNELIPTGDSIEYSDSFSEKSDEINADQGNKDNLTYNESTDSESLDEQSNQIINIAYIRTVHAEDNSPDFEMYLINDGPYNIYYNLGKQKAGNVNVISGEKLEADTKILIRDGDINELDAMGKKLRFHCIFFKDGIYRFLVPFNTIIDLSSVDLLERKYYKENEYFDEEAVIIPVYSNKIENNVSDKKEMEEMYLTREIKNKDIPVRKPKPEKKNDDISEVDLHIGEILDDYRGMSNGEILRVQLDRFTTALEGAINSNQKRIVFIHGLGNGKLKFEVRKLLDTQYDYIKYQDASFKEYGYGATMVILK